MKRILLAEPQLLVKGLSTQPCLIIVDVQSRPDGDVLRLLREIDPPLPLVSFPGFDVFRIHQVVVPGNVGAISPRPVLPTRFISIPLINVSAGSYLVGYAYFIFPSPSTSSPMIWTGQFPFSSAPSASLKLSIGDSERRQSCPGDGGGDAGSSYSDSGSSENL